MSNLCYNCGNCHLPVPCGAAIVYCDICGNYGHHWYFCHLGAITKQPYAYLLLCHNCDLWHMPIPCITPPHKCGQCGTDGHLEFFCPVSPMVRVPDWPVVRMQQDEFIKAGNKRKRIDSMNAGPEDNSTLFTSMIDRQKDLIRYNAAKDTMRLLQETQDAAKVLDMMRGSLSAVPAIPKVGTTTLGTQEQTATVSGVAAAFGGDIDHYKSSEMQVVKSTAEIVREGRERMLQEAESKI